MKFIGFWGKSKETGEPVLEYHPPYEEDGVEDSIKSGKNRRGQQNWEEDGVEDDFFPEEMEEDRAVYSAEEKNASTEKQAKKKKSSGKRQLVMAALVMALGAAVYLNWQFSGDQQLVATDALSSEREIGAAQLVNGEAEETEETGAAASESEGESAFTQAKLSRQKARDEAVEMLEEIVKDAESSAEAKKEAVAQSAEIAQNVLKENNIEHLVKAKGYEECVAVIQNGECSVIVSGQLKNASDAVVIQDIVTGQTSFAPEKIKIVESK